jgi:hypothetical protein
MKPTQISNTLEIIYPDNGGYTGFSIYVWETKNTPPNEYVLVSLWGGVDGTENLKKSSCVLEARFFVFGSLMKRFLLTEDSLEKADKIFDDLFRKWQPIMDEVKARENRLHQEAGRTGIHFDEIIDNEIWLSL